MSTKGWSQPLLVIYLACLVLSQEYYIEQNMAPVCHKNATCFTLDQLAQTNLTNGVNLTLFFQPGEHTLTRLLNIRNFTHVQMIGQNTSVIKLHLEGRIELAYISQLSIKSLTFTGQTINSLKQHLSVVDTDYLLISSCSFTDLGSMPYGDVCNIQNVTHIEVEHAVFQDNNGTALKIIEADTVSIEKSTFTGNQGWTGALYIDFVHSMVAINDTVFAYNLYGGAIYMNNSAYNSEMTISHSAFIENNVDGFAEGGGIFVDSGTLAVSNTELSNNCAYKGGGIAMKLGNLSVSNSTFMVNVAQDVGGGIYVELGSISVMHTELVHNRAGYGGGVFFINGELSILYSNLTSNVGNHGGGVYVQSGSVTISHTHFEHNKANYGGGIDASQGSVSISYSNLLFNLARYGNGGGVYVELCSLAVSHTQLISNAADLGGGGIYVDSGNASISYTTLTNNVAYKGGGIHILSGVVDSSHSKFLYNKAQYGGGGVYVSLGSVVALLFSELVGNTASWGAGINVYLSNASTSDCQLTENSAVYGGGIAVYKGNVSLSHSNLTGNIANDVGSVIFAASPQFDFFHICIANNIGMSAVVFTQSQNVTFSGDNMVSSNTNYETTMIVTSSQVHFYGSMVFKNNSGLFGGGMTAVYSQVYFKSAPTFYNNTVKIIGGGIALFTSTLVINSPVHLSHNTAHLGGAIYSARSTIEFTDIDCCATIASNYAYFGSGIYAKASIIKITRSFINIQSNIAEENGGGLYLVQDTRLYIVKKAVDTTTHLESNLTISNNHAQRGGGIFIDDWTSGGACRFDVTGFVEECFIQTLFLSPHSNSSLGNTVNTFITHNTAQKSGSAIYGGLLDRCSATYYITFNSINAEISGLEFVQKIIQFPADKGSLSSDPLQVTLCNGSPHLSLHTRKGHSFLLMLMAIDQVGNPVNATIHGAVVTTNGVGRLKEGQVEQRVGSECTELRYNVFSEDSSSQVELYAEGPCNDLGLSKLTLNITFLNCTCPIGFESSLEQSNIECRCECDPELQALDCFPEVEMFLLRNNLWLGSANFTWCNEIGYVVHNCPFDYCVDQPVNISLNSSQQIDRQCAYNRSGVLCGECEEGLSLVFASSKCKECSNTYLLLLIPFAVAGIALVVFILLLNITIATGTIYGLIFYANVLAANKAIFLPFKAPNFLTVFVSWVNLDLGIETCFYDGMNSQAKVLLQTGFPAFLFLAMFLIIILSKYVNSFAKLLSHRNPVAALCTLLILSYSKLLRLIIAALQFTSLVCPDGVYDMVWLYDGNVQYFSPSHVPRFVAAVVILTACVLFTTLLFFGQWFPRCSKWKVMKWTKNTKYIGFMDAFHAPFTPKHRYWPGLLLFALIAHNLTASMAPDTSVPVLSAGCVAGGLIVYKSLMNRVYRNRLNNALETLFLLNIVILAYGTLTVMIQNNNRQTALAYVSMSLAFILFVLISCYHFYKYVLKKTNVWNNQIRPLNTARRINFNFHRNRNYQRVAEIDDYDDVELPEVVDMYRYGQGPREQTDPADKYITPPIIRPATRPDQLREPDLDILAPITEEDYRQATPIPQAKNRPRLVVTSTVVEIDKLTSSM